MTFSDTAPLPGAGKAVAGNVNVSGGVAVGSLPYALRQVATRYPVTLYAGNNCGPCDAGRAFLSARGIPFAERTVNTQADAEALQRMSGDAGLPFLTIGSQQLKGFSDAEWSQFLDAAEYPKTSQLPQGYRAPAAAPLVALERPATSAGADTGNARPKPEPVARPAADTNPAGIRF